MFRWVYDLTNNSEAKLLWLKALEQMGRASSTEIPVRFSASMDAKSERTSE
jgi:hypothetical protein